MHFAASRLLPALILACSLIPRDTDAQERLDFAHEVVPILKKHCVQCHANGVYKGGFSLDSKATLLKAGVVEVGHSAESDLIDRVTSNDEDLQMPPEGPRLSGKEVETLRRWIDTGLSWETGFTFKKQTWQAPIAPRRPEIPETDQNPIDYLVNRYFTQHKSKWPGSIDDSTFLRRSTLDLIGLLPTNTEWEAFQKDQSVEKRAKWIQSLLNRKRDYAGHWLTFWNDHLRNDYVGTGYIDGGRKQITTWLYRSLFENKPYDQFARELIAPNADSEGFIRGIKWRGNVNASQVRELQFAQNISQVFLGENLKCASCHDSFINDWKLDDAYGLAAIVSDKPLEMFECDKPTGKMAKTKFLWPELGSIDATANRNARLLQTADLFTKKENGRFTRTIVNRIWKRMMGRGLVEPVDVMGNRPWSEDVLDFLAVHLQENNYDLKKTMELIATSRIYQAKTVAIAEISNDEFVFRGPMARRMTAEQFLDGVWSVTGGGPTSRKGPLPNLTDEGQRQTANPKSLASKWIWNIKKSNSAPGNQKVVFDAEVSFDAQPRSAVFVATCDNEFALFVNQKKIKQDAEWNTAEFINATRFFKKGKNAIRIVAENHTNTPNPAALYVSFFVNQQVRKLAFMTRHDGEKIPAIPVDNQGIWAAATPDILTKESAARSNQFIRANRTRASHVISDPLMRSLGRPNREQIVTTRDDQLSTLQALDLSNGEIFARILDEGAAKLLEPSRAKEQLIEQTYQSALSRKPTEKESLILAEILGENPTRETISDFLWSIVMLPEFQHVR